MFRRGDITPACFLHTAHGSHATSSPASEAHGATRQDVTTHMFIPRRANTAGPAGLCWMVMCIILSRYTTGRVRAASRGGRGGVKGKQPKAPKRKNKKRTQWLHIRSPAGDRGILYSSFANQNPIYCTHPTTAMLVSVLDTYSMP